MSISFVSPLSPVILGNLVPLSSHSFCVFFLIRHLMATDHRAGFGVVFERENPPTPALRNVLQSSWRRTKKVAWFLHGFPTMSTIVAHCSMWHYAIQHFLETTMPKLLSMMLKATICLGADIYYPIYFLPFLGHGSKWACKPTSGNSSKVTRVILLLLLETVRSKNQNQKKAGFCCTVHTLRYQDHNLRTQASLYLHDWYKRYHLTDLPSSMSDNIPITPRKEKEPLFPDL